MRFRALHWKDRRFIDLSSMDGRSLRYSLKKRGSRAETMIEYPVT